MSEVTQLVGAGLGLGPRQSCFIICALDHYTTLLTTNVPQMNE